MTPSLTLRQAIALGTATSFVLFLLAGVLAKPVEEESKTQEDYQAFQDRYTAKLIPSLESLVPEPVADVPEEIIYQQQEIYVQESLTNPYYWGIPEQEFLPEESPPDTSESPPDTSESPTTASSQDVPSPIIGSDQGQELSLLRSDGTVETLSMDDYLWGVVSAEMPAAFPLEALKAQTVAARTYTIQRMANPKHGIAQLCDSPACCQAYATVEERLSAWGNSASFYQEKITTAVAETNGLYVLYQGQPINALFFSSSWGQTLPAQEVWGGTLPYLKSVSSPEATTDVPNFHYETTLSAQQVSAKFLASYPAMDLSGEPDTWFSQRVSDSVGGVGQYTIGGITLTGAQVRGVFALRSTYFTVDYTEGNFTFTTTGYGHNVGMSQYGAKALADSGYHFAQILTWYYSGTTVEAYSSSTS